MVGGLGITNGSRPVIVTAPRGDLIYGNICSFSEGLSPRAARIFLFVSCLQATPFSTRAMVKWEIPAIFASSDLLINRSSRTSFSRFVTN